MSIDPPIFEIPIYRSSLEVWCEEQRANKKKLWQEMREFHTNGRWPLPKTDTDEAVTAILMNRHRGWHYNEVVAWIRVFVDYQKIWGEFYLCKQKVSKNLRHKNFEWQGKAFETGSFPGGHFRRHLQARLS